MPEKNAGWYEDLEDVTVRTLSTLRVEDFLTHSSPQFRYIGERTAACRRQYAQRPHAATGLDDIAVIVALRRLVKHSGRILQGTLTGMDCISATPGLWNRMMCEWPMGDYGRALADFLNARGLTKGTILELGAGVGHASKFVRTDAETVYIKTDVNAVILQMYNRGGILETFDIDSDDRPYENLNVIFASNVLHCARSKEKTLQSLFGMLASGGYLVFSEGAPEVQPGREWCLAPLFGFLDGWWDRGGFLDFEHWSQVATGAGFSIVAREPIYCGRALLGNLIACRKERTSPPNRSGTIEMQQPTFSDESLLRSATPEQRVVIAFSMLDVEVIREDLERLFASFLNWPWIVMQAMHHRTLSMQWEKLKRLNMVRAASRSGLPKNWIAYSEQLSRASLKRNQMWLERLEWIFEAFEKAGIEAVCLKGSALIGDIYTPETRMLGDIDILAKSADRKAVRDILFELGFQQGIIDPVTSTIQPLSREKRLFWSLNAHLMPKFTLALGDPDCPFLRFAVGFDFFDPGDSRSYPSEGVILRRVRKSPQSHIYVPDAADTLISLCLHIFRDGTSATMGFAGDNWNLWKFCDFRSKLAQLNRTDLAPVLRPRLEQARLREPFHYALYYTNQVYGDAALRPWFDLCEPGQSLDYLHEIADGHRRVRYDRPFVEQLFDTGRVEVPGLEPVWSKVMGDGEWW